MHIFRKPERWNVSTGTSWSPGPEHARYKWLNGTGIPKLDFRRTRIRFLEWLRWGWVFLERTRILSGFHFTTHFIEIFVVQTKWFVGRCVNMILTRQTCGQRSSRTAESKRRALGNHFSEWICYMFLISKCRGDWDLGLCTTSLLAFGELQSSGDLREKNVFRHRKNQILPLRSGSPKARTEVMHSPRSQSPLHFDIRSI